MTHLAVMLGICLIGRFLVRRITFRPFRIMAGMVFILAGVACIGMYMFS